MENDISALEAKLGCTFKNPALLQQALVHRSYLNEHRDLTVGHNERLEFLGDAVLELVVTEHLYEHYENPEGELTNWRAALVNANSLAECARQLDLEPFLFLSRGEAQDHYGKARAYILANAFEALIGALYLDQGYDKTKQFIEDHVLIHLPRILKEKLYMDPKSRFQELAQDRFATTPAYKVLEETGPDHDKRFRVGVYLGQDLIADGEGSSKQEAQVAAAANALQKKEWQ